MKNKVLIGVGVAAVLAASILFLMLRKPAVVSAETLLPKDTIYYCGSRSPLKIKAALSVIDLKGVLQESAGLTEEESRIISDWIGGLQGVHVGFRSFTLVPFVLDATVVLDGTFDRPLTDLLATDFQKRFQPKELYRDVAFQKALIPVRGTFSLEVYITAPVQGRTFIAFSRRSLTEAIDRMKDGGPSLADNPVFREMISLKQMRKADFIQYMDTQAYLRMFYDWVKSVPRPQFTTLADLFWKELRLADYGSSIAGGQFHNGTSRSFLRIDTANPLYRQFQYKNPLAFPYVPSNSCQFSFCRLAEPSEAFRQLTDMTGRLNKTISSVSNNRMMQPVEDFLGQLGLAVGGNPADAGQFLTGEMGIWQAFSTDQMQKPSFCFYIGIRDAARVKKAVESFHLKGKETNGITVASSGAVAWSVQPACLLIANDPAYLRDSLAARETSLTDTPAFRKLLKELPRDYSALKYTNYEHGIPVQKSANLPAAFKGVLDLFKGFQQISVSRAEEGMLKSYSAQEFNPDPQAVRALLKWLFSAEWSQDDSSMQTTPPLDLTADEAYSKSIELLSDGRQMVAEERVEKAYRQYPEDVRLLFAQAVLERSRWSTGAAQRFFLQISQRFPDTVYSQASELAMVLDRHESADSNVAELIRLAGAQPDDIYLLWLSAIECREQKKGELGKNQYEKLLSKFRVGPVMAHHTLANILTEYLSDNDEALKHRYLAVSLEAKSWTLQGLANTLTELKRLDEACAVWARALSIDPSDAKNWRQWAGTLYEMKRYEEALEKYKTSASLYPADDFTYYRMGLCCRRMKKDEDAFVFFNKAAELHHVYSYYEIGESYGHGWGVEKNPQEAAKWYQLAADQGNAYAQLELGDLHQKEDGIEKNLQKAADCFRKAVELSPDDESILNWYAWFLATCKDESFRNYPEAVRLAELSVAKVEKSSNLNTLAVAYEKNGQYTKAVEAQKRLIAFSKKKSPDNVEDLRKEADQRNDDAQMRLGYLYEIGQGVETNLQEAAKWYRLAADQGDAYAQARLGCLYEKGRGIEKDMQEAAKWCRLAADQGNADAQMRLGYFYEIGQGVEKDMQQAAKWYRLAADQGNAYAQMRLGYLYENGQGVEKDMQEAAKWYRLAADQGDAFAYGRLGWLYEKGRGVETNLQQAVAYYRKALEIEPDGATALNGYAWFLATCKDESFRNYPEAVRLAELSVSKEEQDFNLDTLAVAYERNGQYIKAVETQKRVIAFSKKKSPDKEIPAKMLSRLEKYEKLAAEQAAKALEQ